MKLLNCLLLLSCLTLFASCDGVHKFDTVEFSVTTNPKTDKMLPNAWIDTNIEVDGLVSGTVRSRKPYHLCIDFIDKFKTFRSLEITNLKIAYDDSEEESDISSSLKLPIRFEAESHKMTNSITGGKVVNSEVQLISGQLKGMIKKDASFTLEIEGHFTKSNDEKEPFRLKQHYEFRRIQETRTLADK